MGLKGVAGIKKAAEAAHTYFQIFRFLDFLIAGSLDDEP